MMQRRVLLFPHRRRAMMQRRHFPLSTPEESDDAAQSTLPPSFFGRNREVRPFVYPIFLTFFSGRNGCSAHLLVSDINLSSGSGRRTPLCATLLTIG